MRTRAALAACLVAVLLSAAAGQVLAGDELVRTVWMWVDRNGTIGFTDDEKRIPAAYRDRAGRKPIDWPRVTVSDLDPADYLALLLARLRQLRATGPASCTCAGEK